jgi:HEAT repeats
LWGMDGPEARQLLESSARDSNNRVAGNALLGLYRMGESSVLPELVKMASHDSPSFRRTAAWVMGGTGDPRFREVLGRMLSDTSSDVRKNSFTAVGQIRAAVTQVSQTIEWLVSGFAGPKDARISERRVRLAVVRPDGSDCPKILPVQFVMNEDGQPIWSYKVVERPFPEAMSVIFLFPRNIDTTGKAWDNGALRCLNWKRTSDLWCVLHYSAAEDTPAGVDLELPSFIASASQATQAFQQTTNRTDCTGFWTGVRRAVQSGGGAVRGKRHLIVFAPADVGHMPDDSVITAALASRTSVQVVTTAPNGALQEFARRAGGYLHLVEEGAAVEERISMLYLNLLARYEIRYQPVCPEATTLKVRVHTPSGWGENTVPLV